MKINTITSATNQLLKKIRSLHDRRGREKTGLFLIEGRKPVAEAFEKQLSIEAVVASQSYWKNNEDLQQFAHSAEIFLVEDKLFADLATTVTPEGVLAVAQAPSYTFSDLRNGKRAPLVVLAAAMQDPGNLGTIIRSALAAGADGLVLTRGSVDPFNPKVVRSAMGALFALPLIVDVSLEDAIVELKKLGLKIVACQQGVSTRYFDADLTQPVAVLLGNEAQGLSDEDLAKADQLIAIPMNEQSESLNVAVCGSIVLFSAVEQRLKAKSHGSC